VPAVYSIQRDPLGIWEPKCQDFGADGENGQHRRHPVVALVTTAYERGVTLTAAAMAAVEAHLTRLPHLDKWFVDITPLPSPERET